MKNTTQSAGAGSPAVAAGGLSRLLTPDTKITVGAWLLCMTGILALINPSDLPASAFFRLSLAAAGFALYAWGRTQKHRAQVLSAGGGETQFHRGIWGWLILLVVLLWASLVGAIIHAVSDIPQILAGAIWANYTTPGNPAYHPCWAWLLGLDWGGNILVVASFPVLLSLLLQKKKSFPRLMSGTFLLFAVLAVVRFVVANQIPYVKMNTEIRSLVFTVAQAAIWVPYLLRSRRAKTTFVN